MIELILAVLMASVFINTMNLHALGKEIIKLKRELKRVAK